MRRLYRIVLILSLLTLAGCDDDQPQEPEVPEEPEPPSDIGVHRQWDITVLANDKKFDKKLEDDSGLGDVLDVVQEIGPMTISPQGGGGTAMGELFSDETGFTYWASVEAPTAAGGQLKPDNPIGSTAVLVQIWQYRKVTPDASLRFVISGLFLEAMDYKSLDIDVDTCPWATEGIGAPLTDQCSTLIKGEAIVVFYAYPTQEVQASDNDFIFFTAGTVELFGFANRWFATASTEGGSRPPLFNPSLFDTNLDLDGTGRHVTMRLNQPIVIDVPLDTIPQGTEFKAWAIVRVRAYSRAQGESYVAAYFRDPASSEGLAVEMHGLIALDPPDEIPELDWTPPPAQCTGSGGGTIAFDTTSYLHPEWPGDRARIAVTRTGGGGAASVEFTTSDGTATAGEDYEATTTVVRFDEGEEGTRAVWVPILADTLPEGSETVALTLSNPACASLGRSSAELTILDDDLKRERRAFTLGGTVTGLEGTGLALSTPGTRVEIADDGPFEFPADFEAGQTYDVTVDQQPTDPLQACSVANGHGTFTDHDVTDVLVTCEMPQAGTDLDPNFGTNGKVFTDLIPHATDHYAATVALQADGKLLVLGGTRLARFNADGTLDTGFGTGGEVAVQFLSNRDRALGLAVQPDGKIVIAGWVDDLNTPSNDDFELARYNDDGSLDSSFGTGGFVSVDFFGGVDAASEVVIEPQPFDGIVVVGRATSGVSRRIGIIRVLPGKPLQVRR